MLTFEWGANGRVYTGLAPLVEGGYPHSGETISSTLANDLSAVNPGYTSVVSRHGVSGEPYANLKKGTAAYADGMAQVQAVHQKVTQAGNTDVVDAVTVIHGEADQVPYGTATSYQSYLEQWQQNYSTDVKAITGQTKDVVLFTDQVGSWQPTSAIPYAQLAAAQANPNKIIMVGPKYFLPYYSDLIHLSNTAERTLGSYYARAYQRTIVQGTPWKPLAPASATECNGVISLTLSVPKGPLVLDTTAVAQRTNYGFEFTDSSGAPPAISKVEITGANTIQITTAKPSTGTGMRLRYAFTATGLNGQAGMAAGNVRDSDVAIAGGASLPNWLVHFDQSLTRACAANQPPVVAAIADQNSTVGTAIAPLTISATDPEGQALTYSVTGLPPGLTFNSATRQISGTATTTGVYSVVASASDGALSSSKTFTWTIAAGQTGNQAPVVATIANQSATVGTAIAPLTVSATDPEGQALTYSVTGLPPGLTFNAATRQISGTATTVGTSTVTVAASDGLLTGSKTFTWTVVAAGGGGGNQPPSITNPGAKSSVQSTPITPLTIQAIDPEGQPVSIGVWGLPTGLWYDPATRTIQGTPSATGTWTATVHASDGILASEITFAWVVTAGGGANQPPVMATIANQSATAGTAIAPLTVSATDPEGQALTYSATGLPLGLTLNATSGQISGTPLAAGTSTVTASASDGIATASQTFTWTVVAAGGGTNRPPVVSAIANQGATVGTAIAPLTITATDPDGQALTYAVAGLPPGLAFNAGTRQITGTPTAAGNYTVTASASDGSLTGSTTFTWAVQAAGGGAAGPHAPSITSPGNKSSVKSFAITPLTIAASDPDGDPVSVGVWGLPTGLWYDPATRTIQGTPSATGTFTVTVHASDGVLATEITFTWTVVANLAPTVVAPAAQSSKVKVAITPLVLTVSDPNGQPVTVTVTNLPAGLTFNAATRTISGTPTKVSSLTVTISASDGQLTTKKTFTWKVTT